MIRALTLAAVLAALAGCSGREEAPPPPPAATAPTARQPTVFDDQLRALDKAKGVQQQVLDEKARLDRALDDAGG